jgi:hypothetical protein
MRTWRWTNRSATDAPTGRDAEFELRTPPSEPEAIEIRPLDSHERELFRARWLAEVRAHFLADPDLAVERADALIEEVMRLRGYPTDDLDGLPWGLTVDQAEIMRYFRAAHRIAAAQRPRGLGFDDLGDRHAVTDQLRHAVQQYRHLFDELVESSRVETFADG